MDKLIDVSYNEIMNRRQFYIIYENGNGESISVPLPLGKLDRSTIINALIRSKYSQDMVEAIVNNHFLNIAEWLDAKFAGSTDSFVDEEYDEMQDWRKTCKRLADEALQMYTE